ncbi:hypothetical protein KY334_02745 [Candidatus Woesearchaeota archaeon]|nr:hypothetical protein [Candidatus Woesearchaeota archaeon]
MTLTQAKEGLRIAKEIRREISESIESGELNKQIDKELKEEESLWDKFLRFLARE